MTVSLLLNGLLFFYNDSVLTVEDMVTMTEIICKHGGTIDKYIGDCIMSLFNVPDVLSLPSFPPFPTVRFVLLILGNRRSNITH